MITRIFRSAGLIMLAGSLTAPLTAIAQQTSSGLEVIQELSHDISIPVRMMPSVAPHQQVIKPLHRRPGAPIIGNGYDEAEQFVPMGKVGTTNLLSFNGISDRDGVAPPDTNSSVGATQVVETVNTSYQVFNKSNGASLLGPNEISSIFTGLSGPCGSSTSSFSDPVVLYDKAAGRWLVTILASSNGFATGVECIAVSRTNDATASYARYSYGFGSALNDYPKFGVWSDAYYGSYNMFGTVSFLGAKVCAYNRTAMLAGTTAKSVCFQRGSSDFSFMPADLDGATAPPSGAPNAFVELATSTTLKLFKFHVDFVTTSNSKFTGPTTITVASFSEACGGGTCIPQSGTTSTLDSLGDRLMFRMGYRNLGTHESLVLAHSVKPSSGPVSAVRWYEIQNPSTTPTLFQQGTFVISTLATWMPSIAMDKVGDIAVGFSQSSSTTHPGIGYTGRVPTDPTGTMESAFTVLTGGGSQTGGLTRWGDYSSMSLDPADDCTFWYATEYIATNGSFNWKTHLNSFKFPSCH